jgi:hypothetical protein
LHRCAHTEDVVELAAELTVFENDFDPDFSGETKPSGRASACSHNSGTKCRNAELGDLDSDSEF